MREILKLNESRMGSLPRLYETIDVPFPVEAGADALPPGGR